MSTDNSFQTLKKKHLNDNNSVTKGTYTFIKKKIE